MNLVQTMRFRQVAARVHAAIKDVDWCCAFHKKAAGAVLDLQIDRYAALPPDDAAGRLAVLSDAVDYTEGLELLAVMTDKRINVYVLGAA